MTRLIQCAMIVAFSQLPAYAQQASFAKQVRPFLAKYCLECHNTRELKGGLNLETFGALMKGGDGGPVLMAGQPDKSPLVTLVEGKEMPRMPPRKARQPKANEIGVLRAWVAAGAKDDSAIATVEVPNIKPDVAVPAPIHALAYRPDGKLLAIGKYQSIALLNSQANIKLGELTGLPAAVTALAFSHDGKRLAAAVGRPGQTPQILLHDVPAAGELWLKPNTLAAAHKDSVLDLAFSPDGKLLATASYDTTVRLWNTVSLAEVRVLREHSDAVYGVAFSPDGKLLATAGADRAVKVWDIATGKLLYTLGEATDWVYTIAWSPDGRYLAAGGVDKSIRVWPAGDEKKRVLHSVFAHQAPIVRLVYSSDSQTLYSVGEDRIAKAWDAARMVERRTFAEQPETVLALAVHPDETQLALGRYDGELVLLPLADGDAEECAEQEDSPVAPKESGVTIKETEANDSPSTGQMIKLTAAIEGSCGRVGDVDFFRFHAQKNEEIGVQAIVADSKSKFEPYLELTDATGKVLAISERGFLGHLCATEGTYALGIRDRDFRGGKDMHYRLKIGAVPVVTSLFPAGVQRGTEAVIEVRGVNLGDVRSVRVKADKNAPVDSKLSVKFATSDVPLGNLNVIVGEYPESSANGSGMPTVSVPGTGNGALRVPGQSDLWKFTARKGERLIVEINARRFGSALDSVIEILDDHNQPVPRAVLRSVARTYVTFRDHNSAQGNIRIEAWDELAVNDYIYMGTQLLRISALPTHPDADCNFFVDRGQRIGYLDTTPTQVTKGEPMYKVAIHPPGTVFPPNGFPVVTLNYRNDDGGPGYGRDSRLYFDVPADGEYRVRVSDANDRGGEDYVYRLTVRPPRPGFTLKLDPVNPGVPRGGSLPITVTAVRNDGFDGEIKLTAKDLPGGVSVPDTSIPAGEMSTAFALFADVAGKPGKDQTFSLLARAVIDGQEVTQALSGGNVKFVELGDIVTTAEQAEVAITPGGQAGLTVNIERRNNFKGRVPLSVRGLPHGVRVLDIGLNGILINEKETRRTIVLYAEPWVQPMNHPFVVSARREGTSEEHGARSVLLRIGEKK